MQAKQLQKGKLSSLILYSLLESDQYGVLITENIKKLTFGVVDLKQTSLYSNLKKLEAEKLISSYWRESDNGGKRHFYSITDYGKKTSEKWQIDFEEYKKQSESIQKEIEEATCSNDILADLSPNLAEGKNQRNQEYKKDDENNLTLATETVNLTSVKVDEHQTKYPTKNGTYLQSYLFGDSKTIVPPVDEDFLATTRQNQIIAEKQDYEKAITENVNEFDAKSLKQIDMDLQNEFYNLKQNKQNFIDNYNLNNLQNITNDALQKNNVTINADRYVEEKQKETTIDKNAFDFMVNESNCANEEIFDNKEKTTDAISNNTKNINENVKTQDMTDFVDLENIFGENDLLINDKKSTIVENNLSNQSSVHNDTEVFKNTSTAEKNENAYAALKVQKIKPARFNIINKNNIIKNAIDDKLADLDINKKIVQENDEIEHTKNLIALKKYFSTYNISLDIYDPTINKEERNNYILDKKLNMFTSIKMLCIALCLSLLFGLCVPSYNLFSAIILYVVPLSCLANAIFKLLNFVRDKTSFANTNIYINKKFIKNIAISFLAVLAIVSINLLFGYNFKNISNYAITVCYTSICVCLLPLKNFIEFIFIKLKIVNLNTQKNK